MDQQTSRINPNYHRIYRDLIASKFPDRVEEFRSFLLKDVLSAIDIITINQRLFGVSEETNNQRLRSYSPNDILQILEYQKKSKMNNSELAAHYKLSRNTISKWKKKFLIS